jgi:outer membrane protein assembly factor BamB
MLWLALLLTGPLSHAADWPQWRGPDRTGAVPAGTAIPATLPNDPKLLWRLDIGGGFSSPVVAHGKLVYLDGRNGKEVAHFIDAPNGREIWKVDYAEEFGDEWGPGPRSTPIIDEDHVYVQACNGEFRCLKLADGGTVWRTSFQKDFGATWIGNTAPEGAALRRGNNGSGVIDGDHIVLPVGGTRGASIVCFDKNTGKVVWKAGDDEVAYSSLMVAKLAGVEQIVAFTADALMGIEKSGGNILWRVPVRTQAKRHAATPVILGDTVTVNSTTIGLICYKISNNGNLQKAEELWANRNLKINLATPVLVSNSFFCQGASRDYVCVDAMTGRQTWQRTGFGENVSATIVLGNNLLVHTDRGELVLLNADPSKYEEKARIQISGKTWSHPAYVDGKLFVREGVDRGWKLSCFDLMPQLAEKSSPTPNIREEP